jgi:iron uptake system component EfeO
VLPRPVRAAGAVVAVAIFAACSSSSSSTSSSGDGHTHAKTIAVTISDRGCEPRRIEATSGPTTFKVTNDNSSAVTEFEVLDGPRLLGEAENVTPGIGGSFSLNLKPGSYITSCPNSKNSTGTLEVSGGATGEAANNADKTAAVAAYLKYVKSEANALEQSVAPFAAAVKRGDAATAKRLFASTRSHYEAIEPIAESFGNLDPAIDVREPDVSLPSGFTGFHRIEKALWHDNSLAGMAPFADKLVADITDLRTKIATLQLEPEQIANGAVELLNEVSTSKITGEEDAFSHTDLSDFAANLAGARVAFESVKPLLARSDSALVTMITDRFTAVQQELDTHRSNDPIGNGYALYNTLTQTQTRALSDVLDTLAEPMSKVAAQLL